jgi:hypothetical protein
MTCRRYRSTLPCLLLAATALSGCGVQIESIAQSPLFPVEAATSFGPPPFASQIFTPCVSNDSEPIASAASAISELLIGNDQYRAACIQSPGAELDAVVERAPGTPVPQPVVSTPADPQTPGVLVTDELVSAVLTGTGEYWYQPVIGSA